MNVTLRQPMTIEQFLTWEERQEGRFEFDGVGPVGMVGGTLAHGAILSNLLGALVAALKGKPCRPYGSDVKIAASGRIRYPDAFVVCTPQNSGGTVATDPVVVFEILSPGTSHIDMVVKNAEYRDTPSIKRYVILQQDQPGALMFVRRGGDWIAEMVEGAGESLHLPEIDVVLSLADLYEGVTLQAVTDV
jgi:Uma2 family endonuclease